MRPAHTVVARRVREPGVELGTPELSLYEVTVENTAGVEPVTLWSG
ncbi:hypothetical protein [Nigerium massiliense]|nr:hypothetical protein [Nigerium massiliense]